MSQRRHRHGNENKHHHHIKKLAAITRGEYASSDDYDEDEKALHLYHRRDSRTDDDQFAKFHAFYSSDSEYSNFDENDDSFSNSDDSDYMDSNIRKRNAVRKQNTFKFNDDRNLEEEADSEEEEARQYTKFSSELRGTYKDAANNDVSKVYKDITNGVIDVNKPSIYYDMKTLLHVACEHGSDDVVELLVNDLNADLFVTDRTEQNALHVCSKFGRTGMVDTMLESLEDEPGLKKKLINSEDRYGMTALMIATNFGRKRVARYLLKQDGISMNKKAYGGVHLDRNCIQIAQNNIDDYGDTTRGENCVAILNLLVAKKSELRNSNKKSRDGKHLFLRAIGHITKA
jgi:hypothetical protein